MSLLHPTEEDEAFAQGHADSGMRKALRRIERLEALLHRARSHDPPRLNDVRLTQDIDKALSMTYYDEEDDGQWRLPTTKKRAAR